MSASDIGMAIIVAAMHGGTYWLGWTLAERCWEWWIDHVRD